MVLQRDVEIPVWGKADSGSQIKVEFGGFSKVTQAINGGWLVKLPPMAAGGSFEMKITCGRNEVILKDILIGEVWIASGQSNMGMPLGDVEEISAADYPELRYYKVPEIHYETAPMEYPEKYSEESEWKICTPENAAGFSAVAYYFAQNTHKFLEVPFGIIDCSLGGASASCFVSEKYLAQDPDLKIYLDEYNKAMETLDLEEYEEEHRKWETSGPGPLPEPPYIPPFEKLGPKSMLRPASVYHNMLKKIIPYAVRGVIFYQGETDASLGKAHLYSKLFGKLIQNWRDDWGNNQMPFLYVQLPQFCAFYKDSWAILREQQEIVKKTIPDTALTVAFDCGDQKDVHLTNKKTIGERLALLARAKVYGEDIEYSGPIFQGMQVEGNKIILTFDHIGRGLTVKGDILKGFRICGSNKLFIDAKAEIKGDTVEVYGEQVAAPTAVRYAWVDFGECNLYNRDGLPARPFRTDI